MIVYGRINCLPFDKKVDLGGWLGVCSTLKLESNGPLELGRSVYDLFRSE